MRKIYIVIGVIIFLISMQYLIEGHLLPFNCTKDCGRVCDPEKEYCYNECLPGICVGILGFFVEKDVNDYINRGFIGQGPGNPQTLKWQKCSGGLPD